MTAIKQHFPVVLFNMLCKAVLTFESVDDHLNESLWAVLNSCGDYAVEGGSDFTSVDQIL